MAQQWLTVRQASELTGYHIEHIRRLVRAGTVHAQHFGPLWAVDRISLLAYVRKAQKQGAKRGPKRKG